MGRTPAEQVQNHITDTAVGAIRAEIESVVLGHMERIGGSIGDIARIRGFIGAAMGHIGTVRDIVDMADAGYQAMTVPRRMLMRVSAAHGYGYWAFQHLGLTSPRNPPNAFLVMHRERDRADQQIAERTGNENFSSDGGLTSQDWNIIWQSGVQRNLRSLESKMHSFYRSGGMQRALEERLGTAADLHRQTYKATVGQYKALCIAPQLGSPSAAAGGFFIASLHGAPDLEKDMNMRLYRQFPYNPPMRG